ncbi:MAG TPA: 50S ribosomal protein L10 [Thermoplasmatales archaeon]|nr:50S ribosomal protein L10 [Thermoplasmatales archaeon]
MVHVAEWKYKEVEELTNILTSHRVVGIAEIGGIPAPQMQQMRENLRKDIIIRVSKNRLIMRALDEAEKKVKGISALKDLITGQTAVIATDMNPFKLYKTIKATQTKAPAKGGEIAPSDIEVKAGDTPFKPGPIVGELQKVGIPAAIEEGKVVIKADKVLVKAGERIPRDLAQMLTRLEIYPLEIGITLHGVFEDGCVFKPDILDVDVEEYVSQIKEAASNAISLAVSIAWATRETARILISKAYRESLALSLEIGFPTKENIEQLLAKAYREMLSLASHVSEEGLDEELKNIVK